MCGPQQPAHRKPFPSQGRGLRPLEGSNELGFEREFPAGQTGACPERGCSAALTGSVGAVDALESSPWHERPRAISGSGFQMCGGRHGASWRPCTWRTRDRTLGSDWEQRPKEETFTAAQCSSQERRLQQWLGWEPVVDIHSQLVLLTQPPSTAFLAPSLVPDATE